MIRILLVDDQAVFREPLAEALRMSGYEVVEAESAPQALEIASRSRPDLVLLDIQMGAVDGLSFLRYMRTRPLLRMVPVILLTAHARRDYLETAAQLGVQDYLLKASFSVGDLLERIRNRLQAPVRVVRNPELYDPAAPRAEAAAPSDRSAAASVAPAVVRPGQVEKTVQLRALKGAVAEILHMAASPSTSLADLESVVRRDPVLAANLLQSANSAAFLRGAPVSRLEEALRLMGMANVVRVAAASSLFEPADFQGPLGPHLARMWRHSLAVALVTERLSPQRTGATAFLVGLFHELPSLFALLVLGDDWQSVVDECRVDGIPVQDALANELNHPLERIAVELLERFGLPEPLAHPIREYHEFFLARRPREPGDMARVLDAANQLVHGAGLGWVSGSEVRPFGRDDLQRWELATTVGVDLPALLDQAELYARTGGWVEIPFPPLFDRRDDLEIAFLRDLRWQQPDPLQMVLEQLGSVVVHEDLDAFLREPAGVLRVAAVEPSSPWFPDLCRVEGRLLVLTRAALGKVASSPGVAFRRLPVSMAALELALRAD